MFLRLCLLLFVCCSFSSRGEVSVTQLGTAQAWKRAEFQVTGVPTVDNPFDPDQVRVDAVITGPSGTSQSVPAFWYQGYQNALSGGREVLNLTGAAGWRLRYAPTNGGDYKLTIEVRTNGVFHGRSGELAFSAAENPVRTGYATIAPGNQFLGTTEGSPLRLIGHNVCWHHEKGTYDYEVWFGAMNRAGENFARLWMWPFAFGLEAEPKTLTNYRLDRAWQLDRVFEIAEQRGVYLLLCLDYHGMYEQTPDYWGGNNHWTNNPYNSMHGGPCVNQNAFFTNATARTIYQKRLRYLVARYGYSPNLLAWEFFNEIDNVYRYLQPKDVAGWHDVMGRWLKANDPFGHLVTTSLTGNSDRSEIWTLPSLDLSMYHSYNEPSPAGRLFEVGKSFLSRYQKPVLVGEFGLDWRGWNRPGDPYLRGFRQGVWGGALSGSVGTAMSWWWENIHSENAYPVYTSLKGILGKTGWATGQWTNITFVTAGLPPSEVAELAGSEPFSVVLQPGTGWGGKPTGRLAIAEPLSAAYGPTFLNAFVHGSAHTDLRVPFRLNAWFTNDARVVMHVNSVSQGAVLTVRVDGVERFRTNLANLDGKYDVNNEYNLDIPVALPSGKHVVDIVNAGSDWFYLDSVGLEQVLPATYPGDWRPSPEAIGLRRTAEALLYVVAPGASYPNGATNAVLPLQEGQSVRLGNWPEGEFAVEWFEPGTGTRVGQTRGTTTNQVLRVPLPPFREDLAGVIGAAPKLEAIWNVSPGNIQFQVLTETGGEYLVERSGDLASWSPLAMLTNQPGEAAVVSAEATGDRGFFRARKPLSP